MPVFEAAIKTVSSMCPVLNMILMGNKTLEDEEQER